MNSIEKARSISIWIFIVPFIAVNVCLLLVTQFHSLFPNQEDIIHNTFPYFDGGASISRTARPYPSWLVFKPAMFLTSYLLIKYWLFNKEIIKYFEDNHKNLKKVVFFGVASAVALTVHAIFLGIKFDIDIYKFFRRFILLAFIFFELAAQAILVRNLYKIKNDIEKLITKKILKIKIILVAILVIVAFASLPILGSSNYVNFKHALEWNYLVGILTFYLLNYFFWRKNTQSNISL